MECIEVMEVLLTEEEFRGYCMGNVIKYRWRRKDKGKEAEDMKKAQWYLNKLTEVKDD
jgi:hypothetical protein